MGGLTDDGHIVSIGFVFAHARTRSCKPFKGLFHAITTIPVLVPSSLPGIALVYLFGNQGMIKGLLFGHSIYGPIGIVIAEVFFTLPHAIIILLTSLSIADAKLYEAAVALRASPVKVFLTVMLPGCRYGLVSAAFVVFTLAITDFGAPNVIGGDFNVLATDVYRQIIGQQNFELGAVVSVVLLIPAVLAFTVDRLMQRRQVALLSSRAVALSPRPRRVFDLLMLGFCLLVSTFLVGMRAVCQYAALTKFYPYDLSFGLVNYDLDAMDGGGCDSYSNSIRLASYTARVVPPCLPMPGSMWRPECFGQVTIATSTSCGSPRARRSAAGTWVSPSPVSARARAAPLASAGARSRWAREQGPRSCSLPRRGCG